MGRYLVPAAMVGAMLAFAVASFDSGVAPYRPGWWRAAVELAVLGAIVPMIYAVNIRIVPVFARRSWPGASWLRLQMGLAVIGAWAVFAGRITNRDEIVLTGSAVALAGGLVFTANVIRLFRQPPARTPAPPLPHPQQAAVDKLATHFTRLAGIYLLIGLTIGLLTNIWEPATGRWDLVWAHAMLVGFLLSMASGVSYHVLARWTGRQWRAITPIRLHLALVVVGLPLMLLALALDQSGLFLVAGPLQAAALALFLANILPMLPGLPGPTRLALFGAAVFLLVGIVLGAAFAVDPAVGARLRFVHAGLNLFGWTGLLISGVAYYLVPRFFGRPLRWPRLAYVQLAMLAAGVLLSAASWYWRINGNGPASVIALAHALVAGGFLLLGAIMAGTFPFGQTQSVVAPLPAPSPKRGANPRLPVRVPYS